MLSVKGNFSILLQHYRGIHPDQKIFDSKLPNVWYNVFSILVLWESWIMNTKNENSQQVCHELMTAFFKQFPNHALQVKAFHLLECFEDFNMPMSGPPGGWVGGIIYALSNRYKRACGIPGLLNKQGEEFFGVSMSTIYKRSWMIRRMLDFESILPVLNPES
jgi:hypothetical protein